MEKEGAIHLNEANFTDEVINSQELVLVDFWAQWCAPCRMLAPIIEDITAEYKGKMKVAKVNVDENQSLAAKYGVRSIPTLLFFKQGNVIDQLIGVVPKNQLKKKVDEIL